MLIGHYFVNLTLKGRSSLPKKFREEVGNNLIIARWYEGCLVIVGQEKWSELLGKLTGRSEIITEPVRDTDRFILGSAFEVNLDQQGRFVIPKVLRNFAKLRQDLVFLGLGDRVEIWNTELWRERETYLVEHAGALVEKLANYKGKEEI